jgi:hypothetical protein
MIEWHTGSLARQRRDQKVSGSSLARGRLEAVFSNFENNKVITTIVPRGVFSHEKWELNLVSRNALELVASKGSLSAERSFQSCDHFTPQY